MNTTSQLFNQRTKASRTKTKLRNIYSKTRVCTKFYIFKEPANLYEFDVNLTETE